MPQAIVRALVQFLFWVGLPTVLIYWLALTVDAPPLWPSILTMFCSMVLFCTMIERRWVNARH